MATVIDRKQDYVIADIGLADFGRAEIAIADQGSLNLTELVPLGGLARVNLSNLRQSSGRIRIESCPVYDGDLRDGRLIRDRTFQFHGDVTEQRTIQP